MKEKSDIFKGFYYPSPSLKISSGITLQYECDNGYYNKDDNQPFCDLHRETRNSPCPQYIENESQNNENYFLEQEIKNFQI